MIYLQLCDNYVPLFQCRGRCIFKEMIKQFEYTDVLKVFSLKLDTVM